MKRSFFPLLMALAIMATSCIKNDESEGVKSIRMSQAALLSAQAGAATTAATADAALKTAQAALTTAQAAIQKAESDARIAQMAIDNATKTEANRHAAALNALNESLQAARDAATKAAITEQIAYEAAQSALQLKQIANDQTMLDAQWAIDKANSDQRLLDAKLALDQAQKAYDLQTLQDAQTYANNLATLKTQVTADLVNGYNSALTTWSNQNRTIYGINRRIVQLGIALNNRKIADSSDVNFAKKNVAGEKVFIDTLNAQLVKAKALIASNGINQLLLNYQAELKSLEAAQVTLNTNKEIEYAALNDANYLLSNTSLALNDATNKEGAAKTTILSAETALDNAKTYFTAASNWDHKVKDVHVDYVSIKNAVATEKGDTITTNVYKSLKDQEEVVLAQDKENAAKADIAAKQAIYDSAYANWLAAHNVTLAAQQQYDAADAAYTIASNKYYDYYSYYSQWNRNNNRINNLNGYIADLQSNLGTSVVTDLEDQIKNAQVELTLRTGLYEAALQSFATQQPLKETLYNAITTGIANLKAVLANEQTILALDKANLDEWVAKINAALPKN